MQICRFRWTRFAKLRALWSHTSSLFGERSSELIEALLIDITEWSPAAALSIFYSVQSNKGYSKCQMILKDNAGERSPQIFSAVSSLHCRVCSPMSCEKKAFGIFLRISVRIKVIFWTPVSFPFTDHQTDVYYAYLQLSESVGAGGQCSVWAFLWS